MSYDVLLVDDDDNTLIVECETSEDAGRIGAAAVWSGGGVSAYLLTDAPRRKASIEILDRLHANQNVGDILNHEPLDNGEDDDDDEFDTSSSASRQHRH